MSSSADKAGSPPPTASDRPVAASPIASCCCTLRIWRASMDVSGRPAAKNTHSLQVVPAQMACRAEIHSGMSHIIPG